MPSGRRHGALHVVGLLSGEVKKPGERALSGPGMPLVTAAPGPLPVLYRDESLVIVNKPSGLAAHRGWSDEHGDYVLTRVRDQIGCYVYLVHRLDRATSGAVALVLEPTLVEPLQRAFAENRVHKHYLAL